MIDKTGRVWYVFGSLINERGNPRRKHQDLTPFIHQPNGSQNGRTSALYEKMYRTASIHQNRWHRCPDSGIIDRVTCRSTIYELKWQIPDPKTKGEKLMKTVIRSSGVFCLCLSITFSNCPTQGGRLETLEVTDNNYPRAYFFRGTENTYEPYNVWENNFKRLMGIEGKCLEEEVGAKGFSGKRNRRFFTHFKENHPNQLVLLHFNGNARDPRFEMKNFFNGHFVYYNGANILSTVPAESGITSIYVSDASLFKEDTGNYGKLNDDIGLCELDENGQPNWHKSEQVKLVSVNRENNIIRVERGYLGTEPRSFQAGKSYAAAHCSEGPWGEGNNLMWFYNYSTRCPKNSQGKRCVDVLIEDVSERFLPGGELEAFDGVQFDVAHIKLVGHGYLRHDNNRRPDVDADGKPDDGVINGMNTYGLGVHKFYKELRRRLGDDRLILADGMQSGLQRELEIINGIESEGWPHGDDFKIQEWSRGLNGLLFWNENCQKPAMTYINHRWWTQDYSDIHINTQRLVIAASVLTSSAYALADPPSRVLGFTPEVDEAGRSIMPIWDELIMGKARKVGWLGKPLGPTVRIAEKGKEVLNATSSRDMNRLKSRIHGKVDLSMEEGKLKISPQNSAAKQIMFTIEGIPSDGPELLVLLNMRGEDMEDYPSNWARLMHVRVPDQKEGINRIMSWVNDKDFQSDFYFTYISTNKVDLEFEIESSEPVWISKLLIYAHPDVMYREFESGLVLANPSPRPYEFDLAELFAGQIFRRIEGSPKQDPKTNDGSILRSEKIKLQGTDALFLIKE